MNSALLSIPLIETYKRLFEARRFDFITFHPINGKNLKQEQALFDLTGDEITELMYGGAAGGAKSWTGATWLLFMCLLYPETKWFVGRESLKDIRDSTLITFYKVCKKYGVRANVDFKYNGQDHFILFANGSRIDLLELSFMPSDPMYERLGSKEYTGGFLEECGQIHFTAFDVLKTRVGRHLNDKYGIKAKLFLTCNPKKNWIYSYFVKPAKEGVLKPFQRFIKALVTDNTHREKDYEERLNSITDKVQRERLLHGNFEYDDDPAALIEYDAILALRTNVHVEHGEKAITCDVARYGRDNTVIKVWSGWRVIQRKKIAKSNLTVVADEIKALQRQHQIPARRVVIDEDGVGGGVVDMIPGSVGFVANSSPVEVRDGAGKLIDENYRNLKSQCWFRLAKRINAGGVFIECQMAYDEWDVLTSELEQVKQKDMDKDGKRGVLGKDEIKLIIGHSPDDADALMMRERLELNPRQPLKIWL